MSALEVLAWPLATLAALGLLLWRVDAWTARLWRHEATARRVDGLDAKAGQLDSLASNHADRLAKLEAALRVSPPPAERDSARLQRFR